ncbi:substrate-binding domain-containing protein [bacterium]|nr:substrate-binding domain-containing protein [bacterium]
MSDDPNLLFGKQKLLQLVFLILIILLALQISGMALQDALSNRLPVALIFRIIGFLSFFCAMTLFWIARQMHIDPMKGVLEIGKTLNTEDCPKLTRALTDLGQGDLSEQLVLKSKPLKLKNTTQIIPMIQMINSLVINLQNSVKEFNSVTGIPCLRLCFVGADSFLEGNRCAEVMADTLNGKGEVAIVLGSFKHIGHDLRRKGLEAHLLDKHPDIHIVDVSESLTNKKRVYDYMPELLKKHPNLSGVYFTDTNSSEGCVEYIKENKKYDYLKIISHDLSATTVEFLQEGIVTASLSQDPIAQGYNPVIYLYNHITSNWIPQTPRLLTHMDVVTQNNYQKFWKPGEGSIQTSEITTRLAKVIQTKNKKPLRIVVLGRSEATFWEETRKGVVSAAAVLKPLNTKVEWIVPKENKEKGDISAAVYGPWIEKLVKEKCDGIAVVASDSDLVPYINKAVQAGVPVVTWNTEPASLGNLIYTVKDQAEKLKNLSEKLAFSATQSTQATESVKAAMGGMSEGAVLQNQEISATKGVLGALLQNISLVNRKTEESSKAAERTVQAVFDGSKAMVNTLDSMKTVEHSVTETGKIVEDLEEHSTKIDNVVELISDIASRVNVLALNASIEATKAGKYGKGFSVVANEVRTLAKSTRDATQNAIQLVVSVRNGIEQVQKMMSESLRRLHETTQSTEGAKQTVEDITKLVEVDQSRVKQIAEMVMQMQAYSNQVGEAMEKVASISDKNVKTVEIVNESTKEMSKELDKVSELAQSLENMAVGEQQLLAKFRLNIHNTDRK